MITSVVFHRVLFGDASIVLNPGNFQNGKVSDCKDRIGLVKGFRL